MSSYSSISAQRAWQIFPLLANFAKHRQTVTYTELNRLLGYKEESSGIYLGVMLSYIQKYCMDNDFPMLTAIVVAKNTGLPGAGQKTVNDGVDISQEQEKVFAFDWIEDGYPEDFTPEFFEENGKKCFGDNNDIS